jgi:hypothetical protein
MRKFLLTGLFVFSTAFCISAQSSTPKDSNSDLPTPAPSAQDPRYVRPTGSQRSKWYFDSLFGPVSLGKTIGLAGIDTARNSPREWGPHWEGFGKRVASGFGKSVIKSSVQFGLDEALTVDSHYYLSKDRSVGSRVANALLSPVTARDRNGHRVIGAPNIVGTYASSIIAVEAWYPSRYTWQDGLKSGTYSLGFSAAYNLFKEFVWNK